LSQSVSTLAQMGIKPLPIGTVEEIRKIGLSEKEIATCHQNVRGVVRGCPVEGSCRFHLQSYGGFKYTGGPRYIGYRMITDEGSAKEDFSTCHNWVRTMQHRADHGAMRRQQGLSGELLTICAQEGDPIETRLQLPVNIRGEVVNVGQTLFGILRENGIPINEQDRQQAVEYRFFVLKRTVPRHPRPGEHDQLTYDQELMLREQQRLAVEEQLRGEFSRQMVREAEKRQEEKQIAQPIPQGTPLAEPVRRPK